MSLLSRKIADAVSAHPQKGALTVDDDRYEICLELRSADPEIGVSFDGLDFRALDASPRSVETLKAWGERLASRLTYLMEPLVVLEVDRIGTEVELRSAKPSVRESQLRYYELRLESSGAAHLRRVLFDRDTRTRSTVPCTLGAEALERLVEDFTATAA